MRTRRSAEVAVHAAHLPDRAVAAEHRRRAEFHARTQLPADLHDPVRRLRRRPHGLCLRHAVRERRLAVHVLARLQRRQNHVGVPVVGRRDRHHVHRRVGEHLAEVRERPAGIGRDAELRMRGVVVAHDLERVLAPIRVHVAHGAHHHVLPEELVQEVAPLLAASDKRERGLAVDRAESATKRQGGDRRGGKDERLTCQHGETPH